MTSSSSWTLLCPGSMYKTPHTLDQEFLAGKIFPPVKFLLVFYSSLFTRRRLHLTCLISVIQGDQWKFPNLSLVHNMTLASASITSARWRRNWNKFYSSVNSEAFASVQPIKLSKIILNLRRSWRNAATASYCKPGFRVVLFPNSLYMSWNVSCSATKILDWGRNGPPGPLFSAKTLPCLPNPEL